MSLESEMQLKLTQEQCAETRFDHFCFETTDTTGIILNYACLTSLLKAQTCKDIIDKIIAFVALHMQVRKTKTFTMHLFCSGMLMRDMTTHKTFMMNIAKMFKMVYPNELKACYVHGAPRVFSSIYELFKTILPKHSRDKIIIIPSQKKNADVV